MTVGTNTLEKTKQQTEVTNISPFGLWLLSNGKEYFIDYNDYPIFKNASIRQIADVESDFSGNLHWKELDADIELEALENPEKFNFFFWGGV